MKPHVTIGKVIRDNQEIGSQQTRLPVTDVLRRWWFQMVYQISDLEQQRRNWLDPTNRNPQCSYIELVASFPRVKELDDAKRRGVISSEEHAILFDLSTALHCHSAPGGNIYDNAAVLYDPAWGAVTARAELARRRLLDVTKDESERQELLGRDDRS